MGSVCICGAAIDVYHKERGIFMNQTTDLFEVYVNNESQALYRVPTNRRESLDYTSEDYIKEEMESIKYLFRQLILNLSSEDETKGVNLISDVLTDGGIRSGNDGHNSWLGRCVRLNGFGNAAALIGSTSSMGTLIYTLWKDLSHKTDSAPRSYCWKENSDQVCVCWDQYFESGGYLTPTIMRQMANDCANNCAQINDECDYEFKSPKTLRYFCVRNKATGCNTGVKDELKRALL